MIFRPKVLLSAFVFCLVSCSLVQKKSPSDNSVYAPDNLADKVANYQLETVSDQLSRTLSAYPTLFRLPLSDAKGSFERMMFFFQNYTSGYTPQKISPTQNEVNLLSTKSSDAVAYKVKRSLKPNEVVYAVSAAVKGDPAKSRLMAANFARFIKEGQLEMSLMEIRPSGFQNSR